MLTNPVATFTSAFTVTTPGLSLPAGHRASHPQQVFPGDFLMQKLNTSAEL